MRTPYLCHQRDRIFERRIIHSLLFFVLASDGQRTGKTLTQAVTRSWRSLKALAHSHSTHLATPWTRWTSTKANTFATHPMSWGQLCLTRPYWTLMVRARWRLVNHRPLVERYSREIFAPICHCLSLPSRQEQHHWNTIKDIKHLYAKEQTASHQRNYKSLKCHFLLALL